MPILRALGNPLMETWGQATRRMAFRSVVGLGGNALKSPVALRGLSREETARNCTPELIAEVRRSAEVGQGHVSPTHEDSITRSRPIATDYW